MYTKPGTLFQKAKKGESKMDFGILARAFIVGGLICVVGQLLIDWTGMTPARILVTFVVSGVVLTAIGVYQPLVEFAGAGATVPLTGFGYTLAQGVAEDVAERGWIGALTGGLTGTAGGIAAAIVFGFFGALAARRHAKT